MEGEKYLTISEAARFLRVSRRLVYRAIEEGKLHPERSPLAKKGGRRIRLSELVAFAPKLEQKDS